MLKLYSVLDAATDSFSPPRAHPAHGAAVREFADACENAESQLNKHARDFSLYCVGEWNPQQGVLTAFEVPERISQAIDFVVPLVDAA